MRTKYEVEVTQHDIDSGARNNSRLCAVATAIGRIIPEATHISVDVQTIRFSLPPDRKRLFYLTPVLVQQYVIAFDAGEKIEPFSFRLHNPAYEIAMRPRTEQGMPRPEQQNLVMRATKGNGEAVVLPGRKSISPEVRRRHPTAGTVSSTRRIYGHRAMRINQQESESKENMF